MGHVRPLWCTHQPRGRVEAVVAETVDSATVWIRPGCSGSRIGLVSTCGVGVDVDGVRHWRTYSLTRCPAAATGASRSRWRSSRAASCRRTWRGGSRRAIVRLRSTRRPLPAATRAFAAVVRDPQAADHARDGHPARPRRRVLLRCRPRARRSASRSVIFGAELRRLARRRSAFMLHRASRRRRRPLPARHARLALRGLARPPDVGRGARGAAGALTDHWAADGDRSAAPRAVPPVLAAPGVTGEGGRVRFCSSDRQVEADGVAPLLVVGERRACRCRAGVGPGRLRSDRHAERRRAQERPVHRLR